MILFNKLRQNLVIFTLITSSIVLGIDTNKINESMHTKKFISACKKGDFTTAESLITKRNKKEISFDINAKDVYNNTPLMLTTRHQKERMILEYKNIVDLLLAQDDIKVNETNNNGQTALGIAAALNSIDIVRSLLAHKNIKANLYTPHSKFGIKHKLSETANIDELDEDSVQCDALHPAWATPMQAAINGGNKEIIKILLIRTVEELLANNLTPDDLLKAQIIIGKMPKIEFKTLFANNNYDLKYDLTYLLAHRYTHLLFTGEENKSIGLTLNNVKYNLNINIIGKIIGYMGKEFCHEIAERDFNEHHGKILRLLRYKQPRPRITRD